MVDCTSLLLLPQSICQLQWSRPPSTQSPGSQRTLWRSRWDQAVQCSSQSVTLYSICVLGKRNRYSFSFTILQYSLHLLLLSVYQALSLELLTAEEFIAKLTEKVGLKQNEVSSVIQLTSSGILVLVDDTVHL